MKYFGGWTGEPRSRQKLHVQLTTPVLSQPTVQRAGIVGKIAGLQPRAFASGDR